MVQPPAPVKKRVPTWVWLVTLVGGFCLCSPILAAVLFPVFSQARQAAQATGWLSLMKQDAQAVLLYASDNDDRLPQAPTWRGDTSRYRIAMEPLEPLRSVAGDFLLPTFNLALDCASLLDVDEPNSHVMLFLSSQPEPSPFGTRDKLGVFPASSVMISTVDGGTRRMDQVDGLALTWDLPKEAPTKP